MNADSKMATSCHLVVMCNRQCLSRTVYQLLGFFIGWDFPTTGNIFGGGLGNYEQRMSKCSRKYLLGGHFLRQTTFLSCCALNYLYPFVCCRRTGRKAGRIEEVKISVYFTYKMSKRI